MKTESNNTFPIDRNTLVELMGFEPGAEQMRVILNTMIQEKIDILEAIDKWAMPPLLMVNDDGTVRYYSHSQRKSINMLYSEFKKQFPKRKCVLMGTTDLYKKLDEVDPEARKERATQTNL